jgi:TonB family protein
MRIRFSLGVGSCICFVASVIFPTASRAQYKEIDRLGQDLAQACAKPSLEASIMAVADLHDVDGTNGNQGHYFSLLVTSAINLHRKGELVVADHNGFDSALQKIEISGQAFTTPQSVTAIKGRINAYMIVIGDFRQEQQDYSLHFSGVRASDGVVLCSANSKFRHNAFLDALASPFPPPNGDMPIRMGSSNPEQHLVPPVCEHCQIPTYTGAARAAKLQGTVVFETLISNEGRVVALRPTKALGFGLDEAAYDLILNKWKMKPAKTKDGKPITVIVPIEVTFRLY